MRRSVVWSVFFALAAFPPTTIAAQQSDTTAADSLSRPAQALAPMVVTATRAPRRLLDVPGAATVITRADLNRRPMGSVIDFFADLPGLDLTGVGPNQGRPVIRGFSGQRVLLLDDGLRVNNTRRQQDFGELPALVPHTGLDRVEILRGPASVLYGSDAIGGVVNIVGAGVPSRAGGNRIQGDLRFRYVGGSAGTTQPSGTLAGRSGAVGFRLDADFRDAEAYEAPAGSFGDLTLDDRVVVRGTGIEDRHLAGEVAVELAADHRLSAKVSDYRALDAGFGYLDPAVIGGGATVDIRYPWQQVRRGTVTYRGSNLDLGIAERIEIAAFRSDNRRDLHQDIFVPFGPPGAGLAIATRNFTDVDATGVRLEAARRVGAGHTITYGLEYGLDQAEGTDSSSTAMIGFGPPQVTTSNTPALPRAEFRSVGVFAQDEFSVTPRLAMVLGIRYQDNRAESFATPGLDTEPGSSSDATTVWAANAVYRLTDDVRLIAAASRGFRSPNLVERFYHGVTPEGSGFQARNLDLEAETSVNLDAGVRVQRPRWSLEGFVFQNNLRDGIRIAATGDTVMGFPEFENINVEKLRVRGVELAATVSLFTGTMLLGSFTAIDEENTDLPLEPVGNAYGSKLVLGARYRIPSGRIWGGVRFRHQGAREGTLGEESVVGEDIPAFSTLDLDVGVLALQLGRTTHIVTATLENVTNALYAEAGNAGFVRPAPARRLQVAWRTAF